MDLLCKNEIPLGSSYSLKRSFGFDTFTLVTVSCWCLPCVNSTVLNVALLLPHRRRDDHAGLTAQPTIWRTLWCHHCQPITRTVLPFRGMRQTGDTFSLPSSVPSLYPSSASTKVNSLCNIPLLTRMFTLHTEFDNSALLSLKYPLLNNQLTFGILNCNVPLPTILLNVCVNKEMQDNDYFSRTI